MTLVSTSEVLERKLPVQAVADALGVSKSTVYRLIEDREITAYKIAHRLVVPMSELRRFLGEALVEEEL